MNMLKILASPSSDMPVVILILALMLVLSRSSRFKGPVIALNIIISLRYILWRGFFTLNPADYLALSVSTGLLGAELYGFIQNILFYYQSARPTEPLLPPGGGEYLPAVDIFITIYNEPIEILLRTVIGCKAQDYPGEKVNVYVLDDGGRTEIKELCAKLGCHYIARPTNEDAKAGNLNYALKQTNGTVVAIFDCDHIPVRSFLKETVGFFADPKVAIVQVPHHFYNPDTFQRNLRLEREITNEQDLFFHVIQPGRDSYNSAFFAGSCGLFRRLALQETGGVITRTVTEDLHTSMVLHSGGYKSVYLNKDLSAGLAPESCAGYLKQRQRWARGGAQVFLLDNPLLKKGLDFHQRLQYFASVIYFFHGLPRIVYLTAPLSYLLFKYPPLVADIGTLLSYFVPHYAATIIAFGMVSRGYRNPFWSDVYETLMSFVLTSAVIKTVFMPFGHKFAVTPKGERREKLKLETSIITPHIILACILLFGSGVGVYGLLNHKGQFGPTVISLTWASYNTLLLITAVIAALERPQRRNNIRLARSLNCVLFFAGEKIECRTNDISETGLSLKIEKPVEFPSPVVALDLISDYGEHTHLKGQIVRNDRDKDGFIYVGINFIEMNDSLHHGVIRQMFSPESSWRGYHDKRSSGKVLNFFIQIFSALLGVFKREKALRRASPRSPGRYNCEVVLPGGAFAGTTLDVSLTGFSMEINGNVDLPKKITARIMPMEGLTITLKGEVVWQVQKKTKKLAGIKFSDAEQGHALFRALG